MRQLEILWRARYLSGVKQHVTIMATESTNTMTAGIMIMEITAAAMAAIAIIKRDYSDPDAMPDVLNYRLQKAISRFQALR